MLIKQKIKVYVKRVVCKASALKIMIFWNMIVFCVTLHKT